MYFIPRVVLGLGLVLTPPGRRALSARPGGPSRNPASLSLCSTFFSDPLSGGPHYDAALLRFRGLVQGPDAPRTPAGTARQPQQHPLPLRAGPPPAGPVADPAA